MIDNFLSKSKFNERYDSFIERILKDRISANQLTLLGLIAGLTSSFFTYLYGRIDNSNFLVIIAAIFLIISFFIDTLDGVIARYEGPSIFGGILDLFCDRSVEVSIIITIITLNEILILPGILSLAAIILCITIFLSIGGAVKEESLKRSGKLLLYSKGIIERSETFLFFFIIIIIPYFRCFLLWLFAFLVFITSLQRLRIAYKLFYK